MLANAKGTAERRAPEGLETAGAPAVPGAIGVAEPPEAEAAPPPRRSLDWRAARERARATLAREAVWLPLAVFALSRAYVFLLGAIAMEIGLALPPVAALGYFMPELGGAARYFLQPWRNWDGHWYALAAQQGYGFHEAVTAFFPLYPLLLRGASWLLDGQIELAGVLISNAAFLVALFLLYQLIAIDFPRPIARRTLIYLTLFPTAYYFSAVYSESLFLLLAVGCLLAARRDRWWVAGALGFLAALTRSHGVLLALPLAIMFLKQQGWHPLRWRRAPIGIFFVPLGLLAYLGYLRYIWKDPLITLQAQKGWDRYSANPIEALRAGFAAANGCAVRDWNAVWLDRSVDFCWAERAVSSPGLATLRDPLWRWALSESNVIDLVGGLFLLVVAVAALRLLPLAYSAYLAAGVILPLWSPSAVHPLMSMPRFALALFPAFIVLALLGRWRPAHIAWVVTSAVLLAFLTIQFASWFWVA